ncbi:Vesicle-associated membrane protein/synaptobrevin-binding protein [Araneus ventricosus]|uniref:Vesicle-associated membrane protein/synaptobrevin-binding protein n=1 Tax=Araneus ventricosus TaxID=182803 RepID=A0A4Y2I7C8_ARAVE|nr:Vesicle-associated membrane protein/synaptobrevin-binding protein [Araneus ventricosus]
MAHEPSGKMTKTEQALVLDPPSELHFKGPFSEVTTSYLKLTNPTDKLIGFKVKTTAPKTYCVRPNGGVIVPKKTVSVAVMLQPFDPENDDRSRDKFMVQSMYVPDGENYHDSLWHDVPPEGLMNSKLKCVFDIPASSSSEATEVKAEVIEQPKVKAKVVQVQESKPSDTEAAETKKLHDEYKKLKSELNDVRAENSSLKEEGLRLRRMYDSRTKATSAKPESEMHHSSVKKQLFSNYLLVIAIFIFILGFFIGKFIL